jgi:hypothetical protein
MASSSSSTVFSRELDYAPSEYNHPSYRMNRIFQQTGGTNVIIPVAGTVESIFELPTKAFSLPDSYITGIATPTAAGASPNFNFFFETTHLASEIYLYTRSGRYLANITNLHNVLKVMRPSHTDYKEFVTSDPLERLYPTATPGTTALGGQRMDNSVMERPYTEMQYLRISADGTATPVVPFIFRLSAIKESIFALKKALLFPEVILMRVVWGPANHFMSVSTSATSTITGTGVPAGPVTITNMSLYLATETNPEVLSGLQGQIMSGGLKIHFPFITVNKYTATAATNQVVSIRIGRDKGEILKKVIHSVFHGTETTYTALDHSNVDGAKVASYYTMLDSVRLQEYTPVCASPYDDYALMKPMVKETAIASRNIFQYNWFHCDDFSGLTVADEKHLSVSKDNLLSGLPLSVERTWVFAATTANSAFNHYTFIITYRTVLITASGIEVS